MDAKGRKSVVSTKGNGIRVEKLVSDMPYNTEKLYEARQNEREARARYNYSVGKEVRFSDPITGELKTNPDGSPATGTIIGIGDGTVRIDTHDPTLSDPVMVVSYSDLESGRWLVPNRDGADMKAPEGGAYSFTVDHGDGRRETVTVEGVNGDGTVIASLRDKDGNFKGRETMTRARLEWLEERKVQDTQERDQERQPQAREQDAGQQDATRQETSKSGVVAGDHNMGDTFAFTDEDGDNYVVEITAANPDGTFDVSFTQTNGTHRMTRQSVTADALDAMKLLTAGNSPSPIGAQAKEADTRQENLKPVGKGRFGNIYQWTTGKAKEAADFLRRMQSGYLKGVFHRNDIGDIDLVWGNDKGGLKHIIQKHIVEHDDFDSVEEAMQIIDDVLANGEPIPQGSNLSFDYNGYRVSVAKSEDGNWVLTAFDKSRTENEKKRNSQQPLVLSLSTTDTSDGAAQGVSAQTAGISTNKDTQSSQTTQDPVQEIADGTVSLMGSVQAAQKAMAHTVAEAQKKLAEVDRKIEAAEVVLTDPKSVKRYKDLQAQAQQLRQTIDSYTAAMERLAQPQAQPTGDTGTQEDATPEDVRSVPLYTEEDPKQGRTRGWRKTVSDIVRRPERVAAAKGGTTRVKFSTDTEQEGVHAVIEAGELQPSHKQGVKNPYHFLDEAQPKDREGKDSVAASRKIAAGINPQEITGGVTAYTGSPSVNARGEVIQGNNRADALIYMYANEPEAAARYKQYLVEHADEFGLDAEKVASMSKPVLVNMLDVPDDRAIELGQLTSSDLESGGTQPISPSNVANQLASKGLADRYAGMLLRGEEDESISELVVRNGREALVFLRNVAGVINDTQYRSALREDGELTPEARVALADILTMQLLGGNKALRTMFGKLPAKAQKAIMATAYRDSQSNEADRMQDEIRASIIAFNSLMEDADFAKATNYEDARRAMEAAKRQMSWDFAANTQAALMQRFSNFALTLAAMYKGSTQRQIQATFNDIYNYVQGTGQMGLFDAEAPRPHSLEEAIRHVLGLDYQPKNKQYYGNTRSDNVGGNSPQGEAGGQGSPRDVAIGEQGEAGERPADGGRGIEGDGRTVSPTPTFLDAVRTIYSKGKEAASKLFSMKFFDVAKTPDFMRELGLRGDRFTIRYGVIARHAGKDGSHTLTEKDWEQLPEALQTPFAITRIKDKDNAYRIYTTLQTGTGEYVVVGADVKNAEKDIEVNAIATVFGRRNNAGITTNEEVVYESKKITPEQSALLKRPNFAQYPTEEELSADKDTKNPETTQQITDAVEKLGLGVEIITSPSQLPKEEKKAREAIEKGTEVKGWYNAKTGKAYLYLPNAEDAADAVETVLHEVVAHKGLRGLLGKEGFDRLCDEVWDMMDAGQRRRFMAYVTRKRKMTETEFLAAVADGNKRRAAADEYIARLAESLDTEKLANESAWKRVLEAVRAFLGRMGIGRDANISDESITRLLQDSYRQLRRQKEGGNTENIIKENISKAEAEVNVTPTEAQKKAGNYKKGHVRIDGYDITIEQPKGSTRSGTDENGKTWETKINNTYGYIRGTQSVDGDHIDVFLSDSPTQGNVYVVDQINQETGEFDEHKVMYGFNSMEEAKNAYLSNYSKGWKIGNITEVNKEEFKKWVESSHRKTKPFSEYSSVNKQKQEEKGNSALFRIGNEVATAEERSIMDAASRNGTYMKAPNGKPTNLTQKQWVQVRTKAFKQWFGDWEKANLYERATIAWNDSNSKGKVVVGLSEKAKRRFNQLLGTDTKQFVITDDAIRHIKNKHSEKEELRGQKNLTPEDIVVIPYLVNNYDSMELNPQKNDNKGNRAIEIRKRINGVSVVATIEKGWNKEFLVTSYQFIKSDALDASLETPGPNVRNDSDIANVQKEIETIKQSAKNSSKVVDENGEPLVVYHGTTNDRETRTWNDKTKSYDTTHEPFTVFSRKPNGEKNAGFFFNSDADNAYGYGYNTYDVFLNMRNPYIIDAKGQSYSDINHNGKTHDSYDWANLAEKSGHDGLILNNVSDGVDFGALQTATTDYVVFSPTQIKSATDNTGEFSTENDDIRFRIRTSNPPKKTGIGYKVFVLKNDKLYPPMVANPNGTDTPVGVWLDADSAPIAGQSKTGRKQVKAGGKGTQGGGGKLAYRPGWHLGEIPYALQFNRIDENGNKELFPYNFVWAEVEYANDVDYQDEAMSYGINANGNFQHSLAGLPRIPENGSYRYRTNPNPNTDPWIISGAIKINRLLTPTEVDKIVKSAGREPQRRQKGFITDKYIDFLNAKFSNDTDIRFRIGPDSETSMTENQRAAFDAVSSMLENAGIEVEYVSEARLQELSELSGAKLEAKRKSEARRKRDEQNHAMDHVTSLITGLTEKEARQERLRWEQQHRDLAKEIYEAALQGNFNDVTLQKINKYIDESTPKNTFGRRISQRVPQKMERSLHAGHRTNAVDALFTRISESAVGDAGTKLARNRSEREGAKEIKKGLLKGWAIATGNWHTDIHDFTNDSEPFAQGRDSTVYKSKDGRHVIKFSKGKSDKRFSTDIDAGNLFSFVFPSTAYDIVGYGEIDGNFVTILRQPVVDIERPLTEQERVDYMRSLGFEPMNKENTTFTNGNLVVSDLQRGNIVFSKKGNIAVLDADVKLYTKDIGGAYIYPPAATDTEQRIDSEQPKFQRDGNSVIYEAAYNGKIYLNGEHLNPESPIHEYTHIWDAACQMNNPELWKRGVELMKQTPLWEEVNKDPNYDNLTTDDEIASEVHSRLTGKDGAALLERMAEEMTDGKRTVKEAVDALSVVGRLKKWLSDFWYWLKDTMTPWTSGEAEKVSLEDFVNMPLKDLARGTDLRTDGGTEILFRIADEEAEKTTNELREAADNATYDNAVGDSILPEPPQPKNGMTASEFLKTWQQWKKEAIKADKALVEGYVKEMASNMRWWRRFNKDVADFARPLENLHLWIKNNGGKINIDNDAYTDLFSSAGRATYKATRFEEGLFNPLKKTITDMCRNISLSTIVEIK